VLVLTRRVNESIKIGKDIEIIITDVKPDLVRIGINAPREVKVYRSEVYEAIEQANRISALATESIGTLQNFLHGLSEKKKNS